MDTEDRKIIRIINFALKELGLFTNSISREQVVERFEKDNETIKYIVTNGIPPEKMKCRECDQLRSSDEFTYYQSRVSESGYLQRVNALCDCCRKQSDEDRSRVLQAESDQIPDHPCAWFNLCKLQPKVGRQVA